MDSRDRSDQLYRRLTQPNPERMKKCWVATCHEPAGNASSKGLGRFCRKHLEHHRRHGHPTKGSYRADRLNPYRETARRWIKENSDDRFVKASLHKIEALKKGAGATVAVRHLRRVPATERARAIWARLRQRDVSAEEILTLILGTVITHEDDVHRQNRVEYRRCQVAKVLMRKAGGEVKRWQTHYTDPSLPKEQVLKWFHASEGRVLRTLGKQAEDAADWLVHDYVERLLDHRLRIGPKQ
jgi:hypothetical protein